MGSQGLEGEGRGVSVRLPGSRGDFHVGLVHVGGGGGSFPRIPLLLALIVVPATAHMSGSDYTVSQRRSHKQIVDIGQGVVTHSQGPCLYSRTLQQQIACLKKAV